MKKTTQKGEVPHYTGHRDRLRGKYLASPESFADYELLELLLTYAIPRKDVKPLAKDLIAGFGSLSGVLTASIDEMQLLPGISKNTAAFIRLIRDLASRLLADGLQDKDLMLAPENVLDFVRVKLAGQKDEVFLIIYLNAKNRMENYEVVNEGTVDQVVIYPRNVIKNALKNNATALIVVHNHPSGECDPSGADIRLTESLKNASHAMDIKLLDHMIVGGNNYFSFLEEGLL